MESRRFHLGLVIEPFLNAVFPRFCVSCREEGGLLCAQCAAAFDDQVFRVENNHFTMFAYGNPIIRNLIKAYKYDFDLSAFRALRMLANPEMERVKSFLGDAVLVPVPLSPHRLRERGFNQAEMIAKWVGEVTGNELENILGRGERKGHQAEKTPEEREAAMKQSPFVLRGKLSGQRVCLVDDVWTTGSTLRAAEKTLKDGGVHDVQFLTLAKG